MAHHIPNNIKKASLAEIKELIASLGSIDLHQIDVDQLKEIITSLITGYAITTPIIPKRQHLYRGVFCDTKPKNISQITYPSSDKIKSFQRANRPGESLFYCCTSRNVPFFELNLKPGDYVAISKWRTKEKIIVNNIGYTNKVFGNFGTNRECPTWGKDEHPVIKTEENRLIAQYLSEEFSKVVTLGEEVQYKITVAIAEKLMSGVIYSQDGAEFEFAGIIYPTIAMKGNADNLAIKPSFVDNHFTIEQVEYIRVDDHPADYEYKVAILDFANIFGADGTIEWKGRKPQWQLKEKGEILTFTVEDGQWVARNSSGEIVSPD